MHIKTYASSECIDERGRGHAFAAFLNMQLASTPGLCVCSCCLLTLCACLHVFLAQERTRKTAKLADKYGMKNISRPCLWKYIPVGSVSHTVVRKCCPKPSDPTISSRAHVRSTSTTTTTTTTQTYHTYKQDQDLDKTSHSDP